MKNDVNGSVENLLLFYFMKLIHHLILTLLIVVIIFSGCIDSQPENASYDYTSGSTNSFTIVDTPVKYTYVNGIEIGYREFGSGKPFLMIMPFAGTMDMCNDTFISILADRYRVIIFDNRGMGYSSDNNETFSLSLFANDTAGLMDALELPSAHIFGSSMGSSIAQVLALEHPDKVDRIVLSSATYSLDVSQTTILRSKLQDVASNPDADPILRKYAKANLEWNGTYERLPDIQNNVLLLTGNEDILTPANISEEIAEGIPDAQLVLFDGAGHCGEQYLPEEYADMILVFLSLE